MGGVVPLGCVLLLAQLTLSATDASSCSAEPWWERSAAQQTPANDSHGAVPTCASVDPNVVPAAVLLQCPPESVLLHFEPMCGDACTADPEPSPAVQRCYGREECIVSSTEGALHASCAATEEVAGAEQLEAPEAQESIEGDDDEPVEDAIIPLFEWKEKILARLQELGGGPTAQDPVVADQTAGQGDVDAQARGQGEEDNHTAQPPRPVLPLTQRFNYASFDSGARVVAYNAEAKGANSIIKGDRDKCGPGRGAAARLRMPTNPPGAPLCVRRYLLNPCKARKWIVIALPEDIKIDTATVANHELFSSSVREFQLLGSMKYPTSLWYELGKFEALDAKHVRLPDAVSYELPGIRFRSRARWLPARRPRRSRSPSRSGRGTSSCVS